MKPDIPYDGSPNNWVKFELNNLGEYALRVVAKDLDIDIIDESNLSNRFDDEILKPYLESLEPNEAFDFTNDIVSIKESFHNFKEAQLEVKNITHYQYKHYEYIGKYLQPN